MIFFRRLTPLALLIMLIAACGLNAQITPQITVTPESVDFGNVRLGDTVRRTVTISNTSTAGLLTGTATVNDAYYVVDSSAAFALGPGTSTNVSVRFIPTQAGTYADSLVITHNATNRSTPLYVTLRARVDSVVSPSDTSALVITPTAVNFGTVRPGEFAEQTVVVRNRSNRQIAGTVGTSTPPYYVTGGNGAFALTPGQTRTITLRFAPTSNGSFNDNLPINYSDSATVFTKYVALTGTADSSVVVRNDTTLVIQPSALDYGNVPRGESFDRAFVIRNATSRTVAGSVGAPSAPFATVLGGGPFALAPGSSRTVVVRFTPLAAGSYVDSVVVSYVDTLGVARTSAVRLTGRSDSTARPIDTALVVTPTFLEYGNVAPGSSVTRSFTVRNQSTRSVSGLVGTPNAPFVITSGAGPFVLTPNQILTVNVQFTPSSAGDYTGNVPVSYVNEDTSGARTVHVTLHGRSDSASTADSTLVDVTPTSLAFGPVTIGTTADRTLTLRNRTSGTVAGAVGSPTSGAYAVTSGGGTFTLTPGQERTVTIRFTPTEQRTYTDSLMMAFTDSTGGNTQTVSVGLQGSGQTPTGIDASASRSNGIVVSQTYPNPMRESVRIDFAIASAAHVVIAIYDINGAKVATLLDEQLPQGNRSVTWRPSDIPTGSYVYRIQAGADVTAGQLLYQK